MKLFVSDLDKTLLNTKHQIDEQNKSGLDMLSQLNYSLCIASGRSYKDILEIMKILEIDIPIIALNGAIVYDENGNMVSSMPIDDIENIKNIIAYCEEKELIYHLYCSNCVYSRKYTNVIEQLYTLSSSKYDNIEKIIESMQLYYDVFYKNKVISDFNVTMDILKNQNVFKLEIFSHNKKILDNISLMTSNDLICSSSSPRNIEITKKGVNKGEALIRLCDYLDIDLLDVVAIGDNYNDFEMLKVAGTSIAMGNAEEKIKEIANYVTLDADDSGVYYAIVNYL